MTDVIRINPSLLRYKISQNLDVRGVVDGDWDITSRSLITDTAKYRSLEQHFVHNVPWEKTELFVKQYPQRFANGESVRGVATLDELVKQYEERVDALYADLQKNGFRERIGSEFTPIPKGFIGRDGEVLMSNAGNHRIAMAKILGLPFVLVRILARHAQLKKDPDFISPEVDKRHIPAMTTETERREYYDLALKGVKKGAVIELGAWLGAATVWLAAAMRDSKTGKRVQVYDRFYWDPDHERKAPGAGEGGLLEAFKRNLGDYLAYVAVHQGDIRKMKWTGGPIGCIIFDAPKRIPAISHTLTEFADHVQSGTYMAWQDFAHFPSYEIVASLSRLEAAGNIKFLHAVYPGTTAVFKVVKPWAREQVTESGLALKLFGSHFDIEKIWEEWFERLPEPLRGPFFCGAALFLCDLGRKDRARDIMRALIHSHYSQILPKWRELKEHRPDLVQRYEPLFGELFG